MPSVKKALEQQLQSNRRALPHFEAFDEHRKRLTALTLPRAAEPRRSLCVLGAGNCFDLDLVELGAAYERIHLVDLDKPALARARARQPKELQSRIQLHAPIDVSGCNGALHAWRDMKVGPEGLMAMPRRVARELEQKLPGPFDTVLSACLISQLLLTLRRVITERHPLFDASTLVLMLAHLRALLQLTAPDGRALFVTDVSANEIAPLANLPPDTDGVALLEELCAGGHVFNALTPRAIAELAAEDPVISSEAKLTQVLDAWLWKNGPERTFLVYAYALERLAAAATRT